MLWQKFEMHTIFWVGKQEGKRTLGRTRQRDDYRATLGQHRGSDRLL